MKPGELSDKDLRREIDDLLDLVLALRLQLSEREVRLAALRRELYARILVRS